MLLMIDNYDSFTFNLVQYFQELGAEIQVHRNDEISLKEIEKINLAAIVLSPGPCTPNEAGICLDLIHAFSEKKPILGVCLGHQSIGQAFGGKIVRASQIMHGKTSMIHTKKSELWKGISNPFQATRYHSLVIEKKSFPDSLEILAWTQNEKDPSQMEEIMAVRHRTLPIFGVQFHPESILTLEGKKILKNFLTSQKI